MVGERADAYSRSRARRARAVGGLLAIVGVVIAISGCAEFDPSNPPTATQTQTLGPVAITVTVCSTLHSQSSPPAGSCTQNNGNSTDVASTGPSQLFLGFRVPAGTGAPASFASSSTGPSNSGPQLQFAQNPQYTAELQRLMPAPAGEEWVGYVSQYVSYSTTAGDQNFTATVDFGLPTNADGSPASGQFTWQAVVGGRQFHGTGTPAQNAPIDCENSLSTGWGGPDGPEWVCVDDQNPSTLGNDNTLATRNAAIVPGSVTVATAGTMASVPFTLLYAGTTTPAATFTLGAVTSLPGASATPSQATLTPATNSSTPVTVSVPVPANAAPGPYTVTLTGELPDGESRTATAQLTVTPAPVQCKVPALKGKTIGKATALLQAANCQLGKVKSRHAQARRGTILAQSPGAGSVLPAGSDVAVITSAGPRRKRG